MTFTTSNTEKDTISTRQVSKFLWRNFIEGSDVEERKGGRCYPPMSVQISYICRSTPRVSETGCLNFPELLDCL